MDKIDKISLLVMNIVLVVAFIVTTYFVIRLDSKVDNLDYKIMKIEGK